MRRQRHARRRRPVAEVEPPYTLFDVLDTQDRFRRTVEYGAAFLR